MSATSQQNQPASLPDAWVVGIFKHMAGLYGNKFADMWAGQDSATIRAFWAHKLGGFVDRRDVIEAALNALDDQGTPPTLPQFLAICRDALRRTPAGPALPPPPIDREVARQRLAQLRQRMQRQAA